MKIAYEQAHAVIEALVAENPNFLYESPVDESCVYTAPDGSPSCIWGHAMDRLGLPRPPFNDDDEDENFHEGDELTHSGKLNQDPILDILDFVDFPTAAWAHSLQTAQDFGKTWSEALESADNHYQAVSEDVKTWAKHGFDSYHRKS